MTGSISPGQAAEQPGFSLDTLRYYERIGLLDDIGRAPSGHRRFREEDLEWLGVLRCLRDTGMPIAQMCRYAELARCGQPTLADRLTLPSSTTLRSASASPRCRPSRRTCRRRSTGTGPRSPPTDGERDFSSRRPRWDWSRRCRRTTAASRANRSAHAPGAVEPRPGLVNLRKRG
jgi:DNA-binding transcriptional MerR regulator